MIKTFEENGKKMVAVVLGEEWFIDINDYRKAIFNMFEMACLFKEFGGCIEREQMWIVLKFIEALGVPEEKEEGKILKFIKALDLPEEKEGGEL